MDDSTTTKLRRAYYRKYKQEWPPELPAAPAELVNLIAAAMIDFGPDRHCDGAEEIAAVALNWMKDSRDD